MQLVLTKNVPKLGQAYDVVNVKPGHARNFLLPNKLGMPATPALLKKAEKVKADRVKRMAEMKAQAEAMAEKLKGVSLTFALKAKGEKLYGSLHEKDIIKGLMEEAKLELEKEMVLLKEPIKTLGDHKVTLRLAEGVEVTIRVVVEGNEQKK